ncbi:MAG: SDR family NAD(P)-dependent oxidoreductase, partial [Intrasporangiaceae bacterium]|nr:SDR family NAD(P)-dependent oxidoreductase [Intrasporangiaceae bacterium]
MPNVLITGASAGLGREFVRQYAEQGHDVVLVARNAERLAQIARETEER